MHFLTCSEAIRATFDRGKLVGKRTGGSTFRHCDSSAPQGESQAAGACVWAKKVQKNGRIRHWERRFLRKCLGVRPSFTQSEEPFLQFARKGHAEAEGLVGCRVDERQLGGMEGLARHAAGV